MSAIEKAWRKNELAGTTQNKVMSASIIWWKVQNRAGVSYQIKIEINKKSNPHINQQKQMSEQTSLNLPEKYKLFLSSSLGKLSKQEV